MDQDEQSYFRRRLRDEEVAVRHATCSAARERHEELATAYRIRLSFGCRGDATPGHRSDGPTPHSQELISCD